MFFSTIPPVPESSRPVPIPDNRFKGREPFAQPFQNVNLLDILFVIKLDNKRCTSVCNALYTEAKVECEYLKALDDSMIPVW